MFAINRLFTKTSDVKIQDQYTKIASLIEEGSILDRRKISKDRRSSIERRVRLRDAFYENEKRNEEDRRTSSRREQKPQQKDTVKSEDTSVSVAVSAVNVASESIEATVVKEEQGLNDVEKLIRDQLEVIKNINEITEIAKTNEFQGIKEKIRDISYKVKSITCEEEKLLYLCFDKKLEIKSEKINKSLAEILFYIHDVSDQVLEYLDRYHFAGVTEANVGFFLLDMNIVDKALNQILIKKKEHLYPKYK